MKSKVTVKEMAGTKIIYAALLACYYWMWARRDWQNYYEVIQNMVITFSIVFFVIQGSRIHKYSKEEKDEQAVRNLRRADAILLKIAAAAAVVIAFTGAVTFLDGRTAGYALVAAIFVLTVVRYVLFCAMSGKEA